MRTCWGGDYHTACQGCHRNREGACGKRERTWPQPMLIVLQGYSTGYGSWMSPEPMGAYVSRILGDLGADVIKIEPLGSNPGRRLSPFYTVGQEQVSLPFVHANLNKRSVILNLEQRGLDRQTLQEGLWLIPVISICSCLDTPRLRLYRVRFARSSSTWSDALSLTTRTRQTESAITLDGGWTSRKHAFIMPLLTHRL